VGEVGLHRALADVEPLPDHLGGQALDRQGDHLVLLVGERFGAERGGRGPPSGLSQSLELGERLLAAPMGTACREQVRCVP
jgi:hypothetical protein